MSRGQRAAPDRQRRVARDQLGEPAERLLEVPHVGGLAAQAAQFLSNAGIVTGLDQILWNSSGLIPENGWPGRVLHALVGYTDRPTVLQGIVYVGTILVMVGLMQMTAQNKRRALRTA